MKPLNRSGVTLVQLLGGMMVGGLVLYAGITAMRSFQKATTRQLAEGNAANQSSAIAGFLKTRLEGSKSFQNLSIKLPLKNKASLGSGFIVEGNYFLGKTGENSALCKDRFDRMTLVVPKSANETFKLKKEISGSAPPYIPALVTLAPFSTSKNPAAAFSKGDLMVISNTQSSQAIYVTTPPISIGGNVEMTVGTAGVTTLIGGTINSKFLDGDLVYPASMIEIGVEQSGESCVGQLIWQSLDPAQTQPTARTKNVVSEGVTRLNIAPVFETNLDDCPTLASSTAYSTDAQKWKVINEDTSGKCYRALKSIKLQYAVSYYASSEKGIAREVSSKTDEVKGEYEFAINK